MYDCQLVFSNPIMINGRRAYANVRPANFYSPPKIGISEFPSSESLSFLVSNQLVFELGILQFPLESNVMMGEDDLDVSQKENSDEVLMDSDKRTDGVGENRKKNHDDANATEACKKEGIVRREI